MRTPRLPCGDCGTKLEQYAGDLWFCPNTDCARHLVDLSKAARTLRKAER